MNKMDHNHNDVFTKRRQWALRAFQAAVWSFFGYLIVANSDAPPIAVFIFGGMIAYYSTGITVWLWRSFLIFFGYIPKQPKEQPVGQLDAFARQVGLLDKTGRVLTSKERRRPSERNRQQ